MLEAGSMIQPADNVNRIQEITARLEELSKFDILDFWEEVKKLEQEKEKLLDSKAAPIGLLDPTAAPVGPGSLGSLERDTAA
jgi:hypothetical protein